MSIHLTVSSMQLSIQDLLAAQNPWWADPAARSARQLPVRRDVFEPLWAEVFGPGAGGRACVLVGPRQVGKSVLLGQIADRALDEGLKGRSLVAFDFSDERYAALPEPRPTIRDVVELAPHRGEMERPGVFLLDEVTKSSAWADTLKQHVDLSRGRPDPERFLATDSSASLLRGGARESLQGRIDEHWISGLLYREFLRILGGGADPEEVVRRVPNATERYLSIGGLPEHARSEDYPRVRERIRHDADRAIVRDLLRERPIDVVRTHRLFVSLVLDSGAIFVAAERGRSLTGGDQRGTDARTVAEWLRLLEQAGLLVSLQPRNHPPRGSRASKARPKVYAEDHGMIAAHAPFAAPMEQAEVRGRVFESVVLRHLRDVQARLRRSGRDCVLSFFRSGNEFELDFVMDMDARSIAVEVTSSRNPAKKLASALRACERARIPELILIHGGFEEKSGEHHRTLPCERFLMDPLAQIERGAR
jgi:predicted AAA+ superfamily ATPase